MVEVYGIAPKCPKRKTKFLFCSIFQYIFVLEGPYRVPQVRLFSAELQRSNSTTTFRCQGRQGLYHDEPGTLAKRIAPRRWRCCFETGRCFETSRHGVAGCYKSRTKEGCYFKDLTGSDGVFLKICFIQQWCGGASEHHAGVLRRKLARAESLIPTYESGTTVPHSTVHQCYSLAFIQSRFPRIAKM